MDLTALLMHDQAVVRQVAERAKRYKEMRAAEAITEEEYQALCRQDLGLGELEQAATTAELRAEMQQAAQIIRAFLGLVL